MVNPLKEIGIESPSHSCEYHAHNNYLSCSTVIIFRQPYVWYLQVYDFHLVLLRNWIHRNVQNLYELVYH